MRLFSFLIVSSFLFLSAHVLVVEEQMTVEATGPYFNYGSLPGNGVNSGQGPGTTGGSGGSTAPLPPECDPNVPGQNLGLNVSRADMSGAGGSMSVLNGGSGIHGNRINLEANATGFAQNLVYMRLDRVVNGRTIFGMYDNVDYMNRIMYLVNDTQYTSSPHINLFKVYTLIRCPNGEGMEPATQTFSVDTYSAKSLQLTQMGTPTQGEDQRGFVMPKPCFLSSITLTSTYSYTGTVLASTTFVSTFGLPNGPVSTSLEATIGTTFGQTVEVAQGHVLTFNPSEYHDIWYSKGTHRYVFAAQTRAWNGSLVPAGSVYVNTPYINFLKLNTRPCQ